MRGNEERFERGKTIKHIRLKGGERVGTKMDGREKGDMEDEAMMVEEREMRERMKIVQSIKNTRFK